jgi:hypothetical protein
MVLMALCNAKFGCVILIALRESQFKKKKRLLYFMFKPRLLGVGRGSGSGSVDFQKFPGARASIFKKFREQERFESVFYIKKNYIF